MPRIFLLIIALVALPARATETLNVYNWSEYLPEIVLTLFTQQTGIKVNYITYESNEEMYEQLKTRPGEYDLVVPSTYYVSKMRKEGLLQKIDRSLLKNLDNLDPRLQSLPHDPKNEFSVPYLWGTTSLFVDQAKIKQPIDSWGDLWRPEFRGKVLLLDDQREVFHIGLKRLGYSPNSTNPKEVEAAYRKLLELMPNISEFNSDSPKEAIIEDRASIGAIWSGEIFQAAQERYTVKCIYPREGAVLWIDSMVIPAGAKHVKAAHAFIDFLARPGVAALIAETYGYATPNRAALKDMDPWVKGSPAVYPPDEILKKAEIHVDLGEAQAVYDKYWALLREKSGAAAN